MNLKNGQTMENNKNMTAVDWLKEQYYESEGKLTRQDFEQAKQMEKDQMIRFAMHLHVVDMSKTGTDILMDEAEQYYNETYGK